MIKSKNLERTLIVATAGFLVVGIFMLIDTVESHVQNKEISSYSYADIMNNTISPEGKEAVRKALDDEMISVSERTQIEKAEEKGKSRMYIKALLRD